MSDSMESLLQQGNQALAEERWDDAEQAFNQALAGDARCARALLGRGRVHLARRDWSPAADDLDDAERFGLIDEPELYRGRAMANYFGGFPHEERLEDAERLIELAPHDADGWFYRGDALCDMDDHEEGIESLTRAIELRPDHADAYFQRGNAWDGLGEKERADADFQRTNQFRSTDPNVYHRKGHYYEKHDNFEQAVVEFRAAIELEPDNTRHYYCGGHILQVLEAEGAISGDEVESHFTQLERLNKGSDAVMPQDRHYVYNTVQEHFGHVPLDELELTERGLSPRAMPDIQCAFNELADHGFEVVQFWAVQHGHDSVPQFSQIYARDRRTPVVTSNPKYTEFDIGEEEPFRCLKDGVWLLRSDGCNLLALLDTRTNCYEVRIELAAPRNEQGAALTDRFFSAVEAAIKRSRCYRGKVLSLDDKNEYSGTAAGLMVHRLNQVDREQVILPPKTLDLLDRNVIKFVDRRQQLNKLGMATKKGLLFYGPPGTGKTHTVHYLAAHLPGHTTLLITGEQVGKLGDYMTLARLYQPAMVVIEDVDLIARNREDMRSPGEEVMLNKLLNEMDGIKSDAEIIFVLSTNRATVLEEALASRPGRIDQAIEFPLPTAAGREKLVRLYAHGVAVADEIVDTIVERTDRVSASFIKELMRRCIQFALDRDEAAERIEQADVDAALEELLVTGGSLNKKLLGALGRKESRDLGFGREE